MYPYFKKSIKGHTLLELSIVSIVFSLFLFAAYSTLDIGLKSWQLGETKSDIYKKAEIVLTRMIKELTYTNNFTVQIENEGKQLSTPNQYIGFETAITGGNYEIDRNTCGSMKWNGHILYYIYPREENKSQNEKSDVYRQYVQRNPNVSTIHSSILPNISNYLNIITGDNIKTVAKDIYRLDIYKKNEIIVINVYVKKHIRSNSTVMFSSSEGADKGTEFIILSGSVRAKN